MDDPAAESPGPGAFKMQSTKVRALKETFRLFAKKTEEVIGTPWAFLAALALIVLWSLAGLLLGFTWHWQMLVNILTVLTFLMLFLLQNAHNRDAKTSHIKLDELIRVIEGTQLHLLDLEKLSDEEIERLEQAFLRLRERLGGRQAIEQVLEEVERHEERGSNLKKSE
jgi:low affinity Fe/Cu permease